MSLQRTQVRDSFSLPSSNMSLQRARVRNSFSTQRGLQIVDGLCQKYMSAIVRILSGACCTWWDGRLWASVRGVGLGATCGSPPVVAPCTHSQICGFRLAWSACAESTYLSVFDGLQFIGMSIHVCFLARCLHNPITAASEIFLYTETWLNRMSLQRVAMDFLVFHSFFQHELAENTRARVRNSCSIALATGFPSHLPA